MSASCGISLQQILSAAGWHVAERLESRRDCARDIREADLPGEKCGNCAFVGGVEHRGRRTSGTTGFDAEAERRKTLMIDWLVGHGRKLHWIERWYPFVGHTFRMRQRV